MVPNTLSLRTAIGIRLHQKLRRLRYFGLGCSRNNRSRSAWLPHVGNSRKNCFIIAGGASFTDQVAQILISNREHFHVFAINYYSDSLYSSLLVPDYYVISDPDHLCFSNHPLAASNLRLKRYLQKHRPCVIAPRLGDWHQLSDDYLPFNDLEDLSSSNILPIHPRGYTSNTAFKAIASALYMDYRRVFLAGFDHNYAKYIFLDDSGKLHIKDRHHYEFDAVQPLNHLFESSAHALHCYAMNLWTMRLLSDERIINISDDTLVDCFERMTIQMFVQGFHLLVKS